MAHKTLIGGTAYEIKGGRDLIGGTGYSKKNGKVPIDGTAYDIPFSKGIPLNTITPGAILMLNESGSPVQFYIAKHDYESGLNGAGRTLLVRKDCYNKCEFNSRQINTYANGTLDSVLCDTWLKLLDAGVQDLVSTTKFYYTPGNNNNTVTTLQRAVFQLSLTELGRTADYANIEGSALPIASTLQIAYFYGVRDNGQWTRTPYTNNSSNVLYLSFDGSASYGSAGYSVAYRYQSCSRPAFTLPGKLGLVQNTDGTYSIAA